MLLARDTSRSTRPGTEPDLDAGITVGANRIGNKRLRVEPFVDRVHTPGTSGIRDLVGWVKTISGQ
jgi:hypothetical protein